MPGKISTPLTTTSPTTDSPYAPCPVVTTEDRRDGSGYTCHTRQTSRTEKGLYIPG